VCENICRHYICGRQQSSVPRNNRGISTLTKRPLICRAITGLVTTDSGTSSSAATVVAIFALGRRCLPSSRSSQTHNLEIALTATFKPRFVRIRKLKRDVCGARDIYVCEMPAAAAGHGHGHSDSGFSATARLSTIRATRAQFRTEHKGLR
jgi:hypothetical protein